MYYNTLIIITSFFASLGISYMMIPSLINIISCKRLLDENDDRKIHTEQVGALGGVAVFAACWITTFLFIDLTQMANIKYVFVATFLLFLVGLKDDLITMSAAKRLILQVVVAMMAFFAGFQLEGFYGLFNICETNNFINLEQQCFLSF